MKQRGHPVRGAIAGFFFGLFISLDLVIFGLMPVEADALALIPLLGLIAGIVLGITAPVRRKASGSQPVGLPKPGASPA
ncbi:MAG: hypothetical protein ACRDZ7_22935 [Acidimicrobiia bacterium]